MGESVSYEHISSFILKPNNLQWFNFCCKFELYCSFDLLIFWLFYLFNVSNIFTMGRRFCIDCKLFYFRRCLSRSLRREVYVCFHDSTPQTVIELAFKIALGYLPLWKHLINGAYCGFSESRDIVRTGWYISISTTGYKWTMENIHIHVTGFLIRT